MRQPALLVAVRRLGAAMDAFEAHASTALGINRSDLQALNLLEHGALSAGVLAERLGLSTGAVTTLVDRLVRAGYVVRVADPSDGRRVLVELEPATYREFARVYGPCGRAIGELEASLAPGQADLAVDVVDRAAAALEALAGIPPGD